MTEKDRQDIRQIIKDAVDGLKELFIEKLNGHADAADRNAKQINELYGLDRLRVGEIGEIKAAVIRLDGRIDGLSQVTRIEEEARDKREAAVETVTDKATAKGQFSVTTWVSIALAILGPIIVALIMGSGK
jgi:hypothetical protein